jgi:two-component system chemotaxis response regulator CheB
MATRHMVVIGGSAGSISAMLQVVRSLPATFPAPIFVVVHTRARERSELPEVFASAGRLRAVQASEGERIQGGTIYVAPPDHHMFIAGDHIHLSRGPKEGLHRPSINATFRSAAACCDGHVIGVLLSGMLDDGASGLWEIVQRRGITIVQDPEDATFPSMPMSALEAVPINFKLKAAEIGPRLIELVNSPRPPDGHHEKIVSEALRERFSGFTCPECRGPLYEGHGKPAEFRCRVGHVFPLRTLVDEATSTQERKLYEAVVSLEEGADISELAATRLKEADREQLLGEAKQLRQHALAIRKLIEERKTPPVGA